jgi:hypothetical protein
VLEQLFNMKKTSEKEEKRRQTKEGRCNGTKRK